MTAGYYPEGATPLDRDEIDGLKFKHITTRQQLDELEQTNIVAGLQWLARSKGDPLTDVFAVALHRQLFGKVWRWAGSFRQTDKNIGIDPLHIAVELRRLMNDARYWAEQNTYPAYEAVARLHHRLVQIHPFPNGNGRHARILADAVLERIYAETPIDWAGGYDLQQMNERRRAYIAALRAADRHDIEPLLRFIGK